MIPDSAKVPAADQTLCILRYLATRPAPVAASAIARDLGLPRSSVYHLLATLSTHGFVVHLPEERRWGLGVTAFELAAGYSRHEPLSRLGSPLIAALSDELGETTHLAVMSGADVLYIAEDRAPRRPALVTDVGVRLPAHLTATGQALLAALPREQVRALYPSRSAFADRTGTGPSTPTQLAEVLRAARRRGYAREQGEVSNGRGSIGAAVRDHNGWPVAAVAVTWTDRQPHSEEVIAAVVLRTATQLERRLRR